MENGIGQTKSFKSSIKGQLCFLWFFLHKYAWHIYLVVREIGYSWDVIQVAEKSRNNCDN